MTESPAIPTPTVAWCPNCGEEPRRDEDGCCATCGSSVGLVPDCRVLESRLAAALKVGGRMANMLGKHLQNNDHVCDLLEDWENV